MQPSVYIIPIGLPGRLWMMPRPKAEWLADEIAAYHLMGMEKVISLLPPDEAEELGLAQEGTICAARGIAFRQYPIPDRCVAEDDVTFTALAREVLGDLRTGLGVGIHCRAGIGRSGMLTCSVLAFHGVAVEDAILMVRNARGVPVPDTDEQAAFVRDLAARMQTGPAPGSHRTTPC